MKTKLIIILFVLLTSGCSKFWYQKGKTFDECRQDYAGCFTDLQDRSDFSGSTMDYEIEFMKDCMVKKGYRGVFQNELPLNAKRQGPSTFHWRTRGIAGSLKE